MSDAKEKYECILIQIGNLAAGLEMLNEELNVLSRDAQELLPFVSDEAIEAKILKATGELEKKPERQPTKSVAISPSTALESRNTSPDRLYTAREAGWLIGVTGATITRWHQNGEGPKHFAAYQPVKFRRIDISQWIEAHYTGDELPKLGASKILSVRDASRISGRSEYKLKQSMNDKSLPCVRINGRYRIFRSDLKKYMEDN